MRKVIYFVLLCAILPLMVRAEVKVEKTEYKGWQNCYRVSNGQIELIVTGMWGPRIIRFGLSAARICSRNLPTRLEKAAKKSSNCAAEIASGKPQRIPSPPGLRTMSPVRSRPPNGLIARAPSSRQFAAEGDRGQHVSFANEVTVTHRITNRSLVSAGILRRGR